MAFEVFDREVALPAAAGPRVTVTAAGQLVLSSAAKRLLDRLRPSAREEVELLYDRDTRRVAVRPVNSSENASRRFMVLAARSKAWPVIIVAPEFVSFWKLPAGRQQEFTVATATVDGAEVLVFDLREPGGGS